MPPVYTQRPRGGVSSTKLTKPTARWKPFGEIYVKRRQEADAYFLREHGNIVATAISVEYVIAGVRHCNGRYDTAFTFVSRALAAKERTRAIEDRNS